ncbi:MAG: hypothetical protein AAF993_10895 [Pseudomonadota bacterium]
MPLKNPSLITRITIGKAIGLVIGLCAMLSMPLIYPDATWSFRVGMLLWYPTVGSFIAVFGVFTWHPILHLTMPWWFRAPLVGAWMNFVLTFFIYDQLQMILTQSVFDGVSSPFWFVLEGAMVGLLIGYFATLLGGEGKDTIEERLTPAKAKQS